MKILSKVGSWIDKLDAKIFGKEGYQPLAGQGFIMTLKVSVGVGIILFIIQMFTTGKQVEEWAAIIGGIIILGSMVKTVLPNLKGTTLSIGAKIGYGVFCFLLANIALMLAMWVVFFAIILFVLYITSFFGGNSGRKGYVTIEYADGSTEEKKIETGIMGEKTVKDRYGNVHDVPSGKNYLKLNI